MLSVPTEVSVEQYYDKVLRHICADVTVRFDSGRGKGKGVFANKTLLDEQNILRDPPLVAGQHTANKCQALVCSHCFHFLGSIEMQLAWCQLATANAAGTPTYNLQALTAAQDQISSLPYSNQWPLPQPVTCPCACGHEVYCSQKCATAAWDAHHSVLCCRASHTGIEGADAAFTSAGCSSANEEQPLSHHAEAMKLFKEHAESTNDIFLVAAQAVANTLITARAALPSGQTSNQQQRRALLKGWEPYHMGWKKPWWQSVACPADVDNEQEFRQELKDLASDSLSLLKTAIYDERFPELFDLDVYGSIVGMFELNNLGIMSSSPLQEYIEAVEDLPPADRSTIQAILDPLLGEMGLDTQEVCVEGTAFYAVQSCINHSCQPNAQASRCEDSPNTFAVIVAKEDISVGDEITISYIDESLPYDGRQEALQDYGFVCQCPLCQQQESQKDEAHV